MGGCSDGSTPVKTAERYDSKTDRWSRIAPMKVKRSNASATALNGNMNISKEGGIRTKCIAKWMHDVEVISVCQHAVLGVIVTKSCKNAPLSFAMLVCLFAFHNLKTVKTHFHEISYCKVLLKYVDRFPFLLKSNRNNRHFTRVCRRVIECGRDLQGIPMWGIHSYLCKQHEESLVSFIPPTQVLLTPDDFDVSGAIFNSLCILVFNLWDFKFSRRQVWSSESSGIYCRVLNWMSTDVSEVRAASIMTSENTERVYIKIFIVSVCLWVKNWQEARESVMIRSYIICTLHQTLYWYDEIKDSHMGWTFSMQAWNDKCTQDFGSKTWEG
jgi:hypothetical protein